MGVAAQGWKEGGLTSFSLPCVLLVVVVVVLCVARLFLKSSQSPLRRYFEPSGASRAPLWSSLSRPAREKEDPDRKKKKKKKYAAPLPFPLPSVCVFIYLGVHFRISKYDTTILLLDDPPVLGCPPILRVLCICSVCPLLRRRPKVRLEEGEK